MRPTFDNRSLIDWLAVQNPEQSYEYPKTLLLAMKAVKPEDE